MVLSFVRLLLDNSSIYAGHGCINRVQSLQIYYDFMPVSFPEPYIEIQRLTLKSEMSSPHYPSLAISAINFNCLGRRVCRE
jgi:hypothetical protein